jgi:hypothetical protein
MTDEQINAAIDQIMDYPWVSHGCDVCRDNKLCRNDYCTDLNAMHEAEKMLTKEQRREYQNYMYDMACEINNTCGRWMPYSATARYRAEAFLRTLGKWEDN